MKKTSMISIFCLSLSICWPNLCPTHAAAEAVDLRVETQGISANLRRVPLSAILEKISLEKEIWFDVSSSLLPMEVSVNFENLSLEKALKRILAKTNYSLISNENNDPIGVVVLSHKTNDQAAKHENSSAASEITVDAGFLQDENQDMDNAVIIDTDQIEMMAEMIVATGMEKNEVRPLPGMPEEFVAIMSAP